MGNIEGQIAGAYARIRDRIAAFYANSGDLLADRTGLKVPDPVSPGAGGIRGTFFTFCSRNWIDNDGQKWWNWPVLNIDMVLCGNGGIVWSDLG